ncbi:MAG: hypothetical protein ACLU8W_01680 [Clostridia bacterium]
MDRFICKVRNHPHLDKLTPSVSNDRVNALHIHAPDKSKGFI